MATPPTFILDNEGTAGWDVTTTPKTTAAFDSAVNGVWITGGIVENDAESFNTPTNTGTAQTFTARGAVTTAAYCEVGTWSTVVANVLTGQTVSIVVPSSTSKWNFNTVRFSGTDGIGAVPAGQAEVDGTAPSLDITTTGDNSAIVVFVGDFNAADGTSRTWRTVNSITPTAGNGFELTYFRNAANYTTYVAYYPDAGAAGVKTVGLSAPSTMKASIVAIEVKGTAAVAASGQVDSQDTFLPDSSLLIPDDTGVSPLGLLYGPSPLQVLDAVAADVPPYIAPIFVLAQQPQIARPYVQIIGNQVADATQVIPSRPVIPAAQPIPAALPTVYLARTEISADAAQRSVVVAAQPPLTAQPFTLVGRIKTEPPAAAPELSRRSIVVTAEPPTSATFVGLTGFNADSGIVAATDTAQRPIVVAAQFPPQALPFVSISRTEVEPPAAAPDTPRRPLVVAAQQLPAAPGRAVVSWPKFDEVLPPYGVAVLGGYQPVSPPFIHITPRKAGPAAPDPQIPIRPTIVAVQPLPQPTPPPRVEWTAVDPAVEPPVPTRPLVVSAQPLPPAVQAPQWEQPRADPTIAPAVPVEPVVVRAEQFPPPVQAPIVNRVFFDDPKPPTRTIVVPAQQLPTQPAFILTPKAGRWGNPPPNHRIVTPTVIFDVSRPPHPHGWARVAHGFEEALPVVTLGYMTGGLRVAPEILGGQRDTADMTGGQPPTAANLTGGTR